MQVRHNTGSCVLLYIPLLETRNEIISKKEKTNKKKRHTYSIILFLVFGYRITLTFEAWLPLPVTAQNAFKVFRGGGGMKMKLNLILTCMIYFRVKFAAKMSSDKIAEIHTSRLTQQTQIETCLLLAAVNKRMFSKLNQN